MHVMRRNDYLGRRAGKRRIGSPKRRWLDSSKDLGEKGLGGIKMRKTICLQGQRFPGSYAPIW